MAYKDKYRSIQLNIPKTKHHDLLAWLDERVAEEERSINSFILLLLKKEFKKYEEKKNKDL